MILNVFKTITQTNINVGKIAWHVVLIVEYDLIILTERRTDKGQGHKVTDPGVNWKGSISWLYIPEIQSLYLLRLKSYGQD